MEGLTVEQRGSLWSDDGKPLTGRRIISARPGTGKTRTLCEYVADVVSNWDETYAPWQGLALLSYTNVASRELDEKLSKDGRTSSLSANPHFVGTIDSFLNQFVFLPHGGKAMGASRRPILVGEPHSVWEPRSGQLDRYFAGITYELDGTLNINAGALAQDYQRSKAIVEGQLPAIANRKRYLTTKGYATQADANYFALKVINTEGRIAKALATRFPVMIIDEAQDMTAVQHALLDSLVAAGLTNLVLVGDELQAIYEWNSARPELFMDKFNDARNWFPSSISGSFRCSPAICSVLTKMSGKSIVPANGGKNEAYSDTVSVALFDSNGSSAANRLIELVDEMAGALSARPPHVSSSPHIELAVLTRGQTDASHLRSLYSGEAKSERPAFKPDDKRTKSFVQIIHSAHTGCISKAFSLYEKLLFSCGDFETKESMREELTAQWSGTEGTTLTYRSTVLAAITNMLNAALKARSGEHLCVEHCIAACDASLPGIAFAMPTIKADLGKFDSAKKLIGKAKPVSRILLCELFAADEGSHEQIHSTYPNVRIRFSTVHGVKGETYDGVLLVQRQQGSSCGCANSSNRSLAILGHDVEHCEEKRVQYVAFSRAAQRLCIAVQTDEDKWRKAIGVVTP